MTAIYQTTLSDAFVSKKSLLFDLYATAFVPKCPVGQNALVAVAETTILVTCHIVKSTKLIWTQSTDRFYLRVPDI